MTYKKELICDNTTTKDDIFNFLRENKGETIILHMDMRRYEDWTQDWKVEVENNDFNATKIAVTVKKYRMKGVYVK